MRTLNREWITGGCKYSRHESSGMRGYGKPTVPTSKKHEKNMAALMSVLGKQRHMLLATLDNGMAAGYQSKWAS